MACAVFASECYAVLCEQDLCMFLRVRWAVGPIELTAWASRPAMVVSILPASEVVDMLANDYPDHRPHDICAQPICCCEICCCKLWACVWNPLD